MKKKICLLLCLSLVLLSACGRKSDNIRFGAADIGGMYYAFASSFSGAVSKDTSDYKFEVKNTAGSAANLRLLSDKYIDLGIAQADLIKDAYDGTGYFNGNVCNGYKAVAALYTEACQIVVKANSDIKTIDDLQGKKICIGAEESGTEINAKQILELSGLNSKLVEMAHAPENRNAEKRVVPLGPGALHEFPHPVYDAQLQQQVENHGGQHHEHESRPAVERIAGGRSQAQPFEQGVRPTFPRLPSLSFHC